MKEMGNLINEAKMFEKILNLVPNGLLGIILRAESVHGFNNGP
jgi:hypothetical protein